MNFLNIRIIILFNCYPHFNLLLSYTHILKIFIINNRHIRLFRKNLNNICVLIFYHKSSFLNMNKLEIKIQ